VSPTSTERGYRRAVGITLAALLVLCGALFAIGAVQGPKLSNVQLDVARTSTQQVRLVANQPVEPVTESQITVSPAAPFTVETTGNVIALVFSAQLDYKTDYTVTVDGVRSPARDMESTFESTFRTGDATVYYLDRGDDTDRIYTSGITPAERRVVYQADTIMEFAVVGKVLAVVTRSADGIDALSLVQTGTTIVEELVLPDDGWVTQVHASDSALTLGFVLTSIGDDDYIRTLFTVQLASGRELVPTLDLQGEPLHVLDWRFRPQTESLVVLDSSRALAVIDPSAPNEQLPLGDYLTISHVSEDGSTVTASDLFGFSVLTINDLLAERLPPALIDGEEPYPGEAQVLSDGSTLEAVFNYHAEANRFDSYLIREDGSTTVLYGKKGSTAMILQFAVSPNEQYVAIELDPNTETSEDDGYIGNSRPDSVTTVIVDIATGSLVTSFEGFALRW
jgi:hypothetical protein